MIPAEHSFAITQKAPKLIFYPDTGHVFVFQYGEELLKSYSDFYALSSSCPQIHPPSIICVMTRLVQSLRFKRQNQKAAAPQPQTLLALSWPIFSATVVLAVQGLRVGHSRQNKCALHIMV